MLDGGEGGEAGDVGVGGILDALDGGEEFVDRAVAVGTELLIDFGEGGDDDVLELDFEEFLAGGIFFVADFGECVDSERGDGGVDLLESVGDFQEGVELGLGSVAYAFDDFEEVDGGGADVDLVFEEADEDGVGSATAGGLGEEDAVFELFECGERRAAFWGGFGFREGEVVKAGGEPGPGVLSFHDRSPSW